MLLEKKAVQNLLAALVGALIGIFASFTVNCTLVEISINIFFAYYFGFLFLLIGSIIGYRVWTGDHPKPFLLASFSAMVLLSGLLCFMLEEAWFIRTSPTWKIPVYSLLGVSVCFALLFSLIDVINYCTTLCWPPEQTRPLVNTEAQIYLVVATAVTMGLSFGFVFGLFDVEDEKLSNIKMALMREESVCYPIGAILGAIAAVVNQYLPSYAAAQSSAYNPVNDDDLDEEQY
jgi:hypothetical protein